MADSEFGNGPPDSGRTSRKEREIERTRDAIMEAAARAFSRRGHHRTTMEEVAREAGYSVGALYTYFKGKEELYESLKETIARELGAAQQRPVPSSLDFWQTFELVMLRYFEVLEQKREWVAMLIAAERSEFDPGIRAELGDLGGGLIGRAIEYMAERIRRGVEEGAIRADDDPVALAHMVIGAVHARVDWWARSNQPEGSLMAQAADVMRFFAQGIGRSDHAKTESSTRATPSTNAQNAGHDAGDGAST